MSLLDGIWPSAARRSSRLAWLGLALGLGGVALLIDTRNAHHAPLLGSALLLLSSLSWAFSSVWQSRHPAHLPPLLEAAVQMLIASVAIIPVAFLIGERWQSHLPGSAWGAFAFLVLTGSLIGFVSFVYILRNLPPKFVGLYTYVNPVVATWAGWWWLNEKIHPRLWVASVLVLSSVAVVRLAESRHSRQLGRGGDPSLTPLEPSA
jgi:drug/metabolite transporter (DMT)-like permease